MTETIAFVRRYNAWRRGYQGIEQPQPYQIGQALDSLCNHAERFERELINERRSPYIDSDESPVEVLAAIYDALDGITDDAANGHNFGTLVSRVRAAVRDAKECEQARQDARQSELDCLRALGERNDERALADRLAGWMEDHRKNWQRHKVDPSCNCEDCVFLIPFDEALAAWKEARR